MRSTTDSVRFVAILSWPMRAVTWIDVIMKNFRFPCQHFSALHILKTRVRFWLKFYFQRAKTVRKLPNYSDGKLMIHSFTDNRHLYLSNSQSRQLLLFINYNPPSQRKSLTSQYLRTPGSIKNRSASQLSVSLAEGGDLQLSELNDNTSKQFYL